MIKLQEFLNEIYKLQNAHTLLEQIWLELDPYYKDAHRKISEETWSKVREYFKFDDSE